MSAKIKGKDLSYDKALPPFLQRLHDQNAGRGDTDRHERPVARNIGRKDPDEDDGPTVIDESGETVGKDRLEKLKTADSGDVGGNVTGELKDEEEAKISGALPSDEMKRADQKMTDGTATKKRKAAKVIGEEDGNVEVQMSKDGEANQEKKVAKKAKKKAKPIKLAFDDDEG